MSIREYYIENKIRNLDVEAKGTVKSTKYFPVFKELDKERIFKPLSKTKPYSTPLFAYSEVYWSELFNDIYKDTPVYQLAVCYGLNNEQPKYHNKGTIVDNVLNEDEKFINILELFKKYPDKRVNIDDYVNYCEMQYDYSNILKSDFFTIHPKLGEELAKQILCSMVRRDDNFHYENVNFIEKNGKITRIAPMIDMEFSEMFMFPDNKKRHEEKFSMYDEGMGPIFTYNDKESFEKNNYVFMSMLNSGSIYDEFDPLKFHNLRRNLYTITELYPDMCKQFIDDLQKIRKIVFNKKIEFIPSYLGMFSSEDWKPTRMLLKDGYKETDKKYLAALKKSKEAKSRLDSLEFNERLRKEIIWSIDKLISTMELYFDIQKGKTSIILDYENKTLYKPVKRVSEEILLRTLEESMTKVNKKY